MKLTRSLFFFLFVSFASSLVYQGKELSSQVDHIIIGGGAAGVQAALTLQRFNMSYIILERTDQMGIFWSKFPVHGELISVNKWVRNASQAMRYDWHSFLDTELSFRNISEKYFPHRSDMVAYLTQVTKREALRVAYNVEVIRIDSSRPCVYLKGEIRYCARKRVLGL
jgi:cation diffusion facilitator CzcD-associated flavoprotein CzcO